MTNQYDEDYFERGAATGKSLYTNYRWLPELTIPMVKRIVQHLGIHEDDRILDFGAAKGFVVRAFLELGYKNVYGQDISDWAIANCDEKVKGRISKDAWDRDYDWIIAKDTLEHLMMYDVITTLTKFSEKAAKGIFIVVPLSIALMSEYVVPDYEKDITHNIRWPMWRWMNEMHVCFQNGWELSSRFRIEGIKDNYAEWPRGNGFITARRI